MILNSPYAFWHFEEDPDPFLDAIGSLDFVDGGSTAQVAGTFGNARDFDGVASESDQAANAAAFSPAGSFCWMILFKPDSADGVLISKDGTATAREYRLGLDVGYLSWLISDDNVNWIGVLWPDAISTGDWHV